MATVSVTPVADAMYSVASVDATCSISGAGCMFTGASTTLSVYWIWAPSHLLNSPDQGDLSSYHYGNLNLFVIVLHLRKSGKLASALQLGSRSFAASQQARLPMVQDTESEKTSIVFCSVWMVGAWRCSTTGTPTTLSMCRTCGISSVFCAVFAVGNKLCCATGVSFTLSQWRFAPWRSAL